MLPTYIITSSLKSFCGRYTKCMSLVIAGIDFIPSCGYFQTIWDNIQLMTNYCLFRAALFTFFLKIRVFASDPIRRKEQIRRYITTAIWFFTSLVLALFIPNIGEAIAVVGGLAGCFILLFPGDNVFHLFCIRYIVCINLTALSQAVFPTEL